jgi:predicted ester cyclase
MPQFISRLTTSAALALAAMTATSVWAQTMTVEQARKQVAPFYEMLNQPATKDLKALSEQALSPDWKSYSSETDFKGRDGFVAQVGGFGKLIPDLKWDIKDVMVDGNRIIVRSEASGTPVAPFFGVPPSGKSFKIMTIDIHTIKDGKAITAHHVEDWANALGQLKSGAPTSSSAAATLSADQAKQIVTPLYEVLSLQHKGDDALKVMEKTVQADWSFGSTDDSDRKRRDQFTKETLYFGGVVPNLRSEVKDVLVSGDKVIVRRTISGTPAKPLFGIEPRGKSFAVMAIDIHTIKDGKLARTDYVGNWAAAAGQLGAK